MKKSIRIPSFAFPVLALVIVASLLLALESNLLWKLQEANLFLSSRVFFLEQMAEPGGFLSWIGAWFTQFFFYPWAGVLLLCGWWMLLMWLVMRTFRVGKRWMPVVVIPVLLLLTTVVNMGYWVYILKLRGHVFLATIGTASVVVLLWAFRSLSLRSQVHTTLLRCAFVLLTCVVGYPLLGIYGVAAAVLMSVWIWRLELNRLSALAVSLTGLLSVVLLPLFFYRFVYYQTNIADIYIPKLPLYYVTEAHFAYYVPFILLFLFFLVMVCLLPASVVPQQGSEEKPRSQKGKAAARVSRAALRERVGACLLLLSVAVYTAFSWYRDENFHRELAMQRCIDRLDWDGVLSVASKQHDEPTRAVVMMRNVALARLGRQGDEMFRYRNGCRPCAAPFDFRAVNTVGPLIYYHYGMPNYSHRLCMECGVEFGWHTEHLKYMARCAILNGEQQLARKYLSLLGQTLFYRAWARHLSPLVGNPDAVARAPETGFITHLMHYNNELTHDHHMMEKFLMGHLIGTPYTADPLFVEQALYATMWAKDINAFWAHLRTFTRLHPDKPWPKHVQEAAVMFSALQPTSPSPRLPVSNAVIDSYKRFDRMAERLEGADLQAAAAALQPQFGNTYFYYYYMIHFAAQE